MPLIPPGRLLPPRRLWPARSAEKRQSSHRHPVQPRSQVSGDTTGIIALAIVIVIIVLVGAIMGTNKPIRKKTS